VKGSSKKKKQKKNQTSRVVIPHVHH